MKSDPKDIPENLLFAAVDKGLEGFDLNPEITSLDIGVSVLTGETYKTVVPFIFSLILGIVLITLFLWSAQMVIKQNLKRFILCMNF